MPKQSQTAQAFAAAEAKLREEIAQAEAAVERAQERKAAAGARLEELLRVKELVAGAQAPGAPVQPKAKTAAKPKAKQAPKRVARATSGLPAPGTATRAIFDAVVGGARSYRDIGERTGFPGTKISNVLPNLVKQGLVVKVGRDDYAPAEGVG